MIKIEHWRTYGWEAAIRGMRNPMNSWDKSDSHYCWEEGVGCWNCELSGQDVCHAEQYNVGEADLELMKKLASAGDVHGKFLRMITVTCDITAPLYWWKEFDTYKVGTVANSCSTMHKIHEKEFTLNDFSHEHLVDVHIDFLSEIIEALNGIREVYLGYEGHEDELKRNFGVESKKDIWWQMIQLLPSSYNQKRTVQLNYSVLKNIYEYRSNHKLDEWRELCDWIKLLPYSELIIG